MDTPIDDQLKRDLLGERRNIVFVEGTDSSLDKPLYNLLFPMASVIPRGNCREVERAVAGVRAGEPLHWLRAFGIVDGDGSDATESHARSSTGVYVLPFYAVESVYYHPRIIEMISQRQAAVTGDASSDLTHRALSAGVAAISDDTERLARKASKKLLREQVYRAIPNDDDLLLGEPVTVQNNANEVLAERKRDLDAAVANSDWEVLVAKCPVRESRALADIASSLGFLSRWEYERAVRHLLGSDDKAMEFVRGLFGDLVERLNDNPILQR